MRTFFLLLLLWVGALAHADGLALAFEDEPTIPVQRAIIEFDGKRESLTVESTIDSRRADVGWIVPVPAKPTSVTVGWNQTIHKAFFQMRPPVTLVGQGQITFVVVSLVFVLAGLTNLWRRPEGRAGFVGYAVIGLFALLMMRVYFGLVDIGDSSDNGMGRPPEVAGTFTFKTIDGRSKGVLESWLKENKFTPSPRALRQLDRLRSEGWWFVCATHRREQAGEFPVDPIRITFPTKTPIYPMRLTSAQGTLPHVELLVIADGTARSPDLDLLRSRHLNLTVFEERGEVYETFEIGEDKMVSYLRREVTHEQIDRDFAIDTGHPTEISVSLIRRSEVATLLILHTLTFALPCAWLAGIIGAVRWKRCHDWIRWGALVSLVVSLVWTASWVIPAPKINATVSDRHDIMPW